jgi:hypothetical protein
VVPRNISYIKLSQRNEYYIELSQRNVYYRVPSVSYQSDIPVQLAIEINLSNIAIQLATKCYQPYISWLGAPHRKHFC